MLSSRLTRSVLSFTTTTTTTTSICISSLHTFSRNKQQSSIINVNPFHIISINNNNPLQFSTIKNTFNQLEKPKPKPFSSTSLSIMDNGIEHKTVKVNGINMHYAEKGKDGPVILFIHGFPELWYTWRHQITALTNLGYRAIAPDLRGFGDTDAPESVSSYTCMHVIGDLIELIETVAGDQDKIFVVGHDWGAIIAWYLCLFRPDKVKALVNLSVVFNPRNPKIKPLDMLAKVFGDDYYICRFQEPGVIEAEFAKKGTERIIKEFYTYRDPGPLFIPRAKGFNGRPLDSQITLHPWLSQEDINYYTTKYENRGFRGGVNYYRNIDTNWELTAPWTGTKIKVPVKFIVGDLDLTYNSPGTKEYIHNGGFKKFVPFLQEVVVMEGVGHFINEERPEEVNNHIHDFFQKF